MKKTKYTYDNISLRQYCIENNMPYGTIKKKLVSLKKEKPNLTDDELVKEVMKESFEPGLKYKYKGTSLFNYCKENNLSYKKILDRLSNLDSKYDSFSIEEKIEVVIKDYDIPKTKYVYQGKKLSDYCKENNLSYKSFLKKLNRVKKQNPNISDNDAIVKVLELDGYFNCEYYYKGVPLKKYCLENDIDYFKVCNKIKNIKRNKGLENYTIDNIIKLAVSYVSEGVTRYKYFYNGKLISELLNQNGLSKNLTRSAFKNKDNIEEYIRNEQKKLLNKKINELMDKLEILEVQERNKLLNYMNIDINCLNELLKSGYSFKDSILYIWFFGTLIDGKLKISISDIEKIKRDINYSNKSIDYLIRLNKCGINTKDYIYNYYKEYIRRTSSYFIYSHNLKYSEDLLNDLIAECNYYLLKIINENYILINIDNYIKKTLKLHIRSYILNNTNYYNKVLYIEDLTEKKISVEDEMESVYNKDISNCFSESFKELFKILNKDGEDFIKYKYIDNMDNNEISEIMKKDITYVNDMEENIIYYLRKEYKK